jgi:hypothetical protein
MFTDLLQLVASLDHDFREEDGISVHAFGCRRCAITQRLKSLRKQMHLLLRDIEFEVGGSQERSETDLNIPPVSQTPTARR